MPWAVVRRATRRYRRIVLWMCTVMWHFSPGPPNTMTVVHLEPSTGKIKPEERTRPARAAIIAVDLTWVPCMQDGEVVHSDDLRHGGHRQACSLASTPTACPSPRAR
jgi:hypothetical protein